MKTEKYCGSQDCVSSDFTVDEMTPRRYQVPLTLMVNPPPESPLHGPDPLTLLARFESSPAQNVRPDVIVPKILLDSKQLPVSMTVISAHLGTLVDRALVSVLPQPAITTFRPTMSSKDSDVVGRQIGRMFLVNRNDFSKTATAMSASKFEVR